MRSLIVADKVYHSKIIFIRIFTQTPPQLLQKYHIGLGRPQEHHGIHRGYINTLIEDVHCKDNLDLSFFQCFDCTLPVHCVRTDQFAAVNRSCSCPMTGKIISHVFGMFDRYTETQGPLSRKFTVVIHNQIRSFLIGQLPFQVFHNITSVGDLYLVVISGIIDGIIAKRHK
jgi:hypothetical protein